jgi:hypothetical protein
MTAVCAVVQAVVDVMKMADDAAVGECSLAPMSQAVMMNDVNQVPTAMQSV